MEITFSNDDLKKNTVVPPAWYKVHIISATDSASRDGNSINTWLVGEIICSSDTGSTEFAGVPTPKFWMFNSKATFRLLPLLDALGIKPKKDEKFDTAFLNDKIVDVFIGTEMGKNADKQPTGAMVNCITGQYRASK